MSLRVPFALGYSHPTTIVIVDDNQTFLRDLELNIPPGTLYRSFSDPYEALAFFEENNGAKKSLLHRAISFHSQVGSDTLLKVDMALFEEAILDSSRFSIPTVLITDYDMPSLNGLKLCERIPDPAVKKILLTGKADEHTGVQAFNDGLIDRYIAKASRDAADHAFEYAAALQEEYFTGAQNTLLGQSAGLSNLFNDQVAINRILEIKKQHGYVEHYLATDPFGYMLVGADGSVGRIAIADEGDLHRQFELALDCGAPEHALICLENRTHMVISYQGLDELYRGSSVWDDMMFRCEELTGRRKWYLSLDPHAPMSVDYYAQQDSFACSPD